MPNLTGIYVDDVTDLTIGGIAVGTGNLISGNTTNGIDLIFGTTGTSIAGNRIGTNLAGTAAIANDIGVKIKN